MKKFVRCYACRRRAVSFVPIPLCQFHEIPPQIPIGNQDSDEEILFEDLDDEGYTPFNYEDDFPIPIYPI